MKPHQMTLAYAKVLQYWVEKVNLPVSGDPHPLARCVRELRQQVGRYITCNEQEILDGLGDVLLKNERGKTPPVDFPAAMDNEDAWFSPAQTSPAENLTRPANEGEGKEKCTPVGSDSTLPRRWLPQKICPENAGLLCLEAYQSWVHRTRKKKVLTP